MAYIFHLFYILFSAKTQQRNTIIPAFGSSVVGLTVVVGGSVAPVAKGACPSGHQLQMAWQTPATLMALLLYNGHGAFVTSQAPFLVKSV